MSDNQTIPTKRYMDQITGEKEADQAEKIDLKTAIQLMNGASLDISLTQLSAMAEEFADYAPFKEAMMNIKATDSDRLVTLDHIWSTDVKPVRDAMGKLLRETHPKLYERAPKVEDHGGVEVTYDRGNAYEAALNAFVAGQGKRVFGDKISIGAEVIAY